MQVLVYMCRETADRSTLVSQDCGGFADRIVGSAHMFLFAMLNRFFYMAEWQGQPMAFGSPFLNYTFDVNLVE